LRYRAYPADVIEAGKKALVDVLREQSALNSDFKEVADDATAFLAQSKAWSKASLHYFLNTRE